MMRSALLLAAVASASALHLGGSHSVGIPTTKLQAFSKEQLLTRTSLPLKGKDLQAIRGGEAAASPLKLLLLVTGWYAGNYYYNIYNKKATNAIHAHWTVAFTQLVVGVVWSFCMWIPGIRKAPVLSNDEIKSLAPIGLFAACAHGGSVLAMGAGKVSFAQIVKAAEPVFVALLCLFIKPVEIKSPLAYAMLMMIVGGVGLACIKPGEGLKISAEDMGPLAWASFANLAAGLKNKLGKDITHDLKAKADTNNMSAANAYAVVNMLSAAWTLIAVLTQEAATLPDEWKKATAKTPAKTIATNVALSGIFFYLYNELAFMFLSEVGPVTSSVMNTAKRVIVIIGTAIVFGEKMNSNTKLGATIAVSGVFLYSLAEEWDKQAKKKASQ